MYVLKVLEKCIVSTDDSILCQICHFCKLHTNMGKFGRLNIAVDERKFFFLLFSDDALAVLCLIQLQWKLSAMTTLGAEESGHL